MKYRQIAQGWISLIKSKLGYISPELKELSVNRQSICNACEHRNAANACNICGCYIPAKSKVYTETCPDNRWMPVYYYLQGSNVIICEEVTPLLRERLYKYLGGRPVNITVAKWEKFLNSGF